MEVIETKSPAGTMSFGRSFAKKLKAGDCVALPGELGAGKTVLVRGIAQGLGVSDPTIVSSPSFVLVQEYSGKVPIYHVDLYRTVEAGNELPHLGIEEMLSDGVVIVEWADRAPLALPRTRWEIEITPTSRTGRSFSIRRIG